MFQLKISFYSYDFVVAGLKSTICITTDNWGIANLCDKHTHNKSLDFVSDFDLSYFQCFPAEKDMILLCNFSSTPLNNSELTLVKPCRQKKPYYQQATFIINFKTVCRENIQVFVRVSTIQGNSH